MSCRLLKTMLIDTLGCTQLPHLNTSVRCAGMCSPYCERGLPQPAPARPSRKKTAPQNVLPGIYSCKTSNHTKSLSNSRPTIGPKNLRVIIQINKWRPSAKQFVAKFHAWTPSIGLDQDMKHWAAAIPFRKKNANPKTALIPCRGYSWRPQYRGLDHRSGSVWIVRSGLQVWIGGLDLWVFRVGPDLEFLACRQICTLAQALAATTFPKGNKVTKPQDRIWILSNALAPTTLQKGMQASMPANRFVYFSSFGSHNLSKRNQSHQTRNQIQVYFVRSQR